MRLSGDISTYPIGPPDKSPSQLCPLVRVDSTALSLHLRPPEPAGDFHQANSNQAGRDFWRGWVCHSCGMANERKKWKEWDCDACGVSTMSP